jgi:transcription elongation GreA/GreB family factor
MRRHSFITAIFNNFGFVFNPRMKLKEQVLDACLQQQQDSIKRLKELVKELQESANEEKGASSGEDGVSMREQLQYDVDMYSRQLDQASASYATLKLIDPNQVNSTVKHGALVMTDKTNVLVGASIGKIVVEGKTFFTISIESPLYQAMEGKKKGETFAFRDQTQTVLEVM